MATVEEIDYSSNTREKFCTIYPEVDFFPQLLMFGPPSTALAGSELYREATRRSVILDEIMKLRGETFPAEDLRFPVWAEEDYFRRFHRRL